MPVPHGSGIFYWEKNEMRTPGCFFVMLFSVFYAFGQGGAAQPKNVNNYPARTFFEQNRSELRAAMPENSIAIIFSAGTKNRSNDVDYIFHQDPSFYYLTGLKEPDAVLIIYQSPYESSGIKISEQLFIPASDENEERWTGKTTSIDEAKNISGIQTVLYSCSFKTLEIDTNRFSKILYMPMPTGLVNVKNDSCDLYDMVDSFKRKVSFPPAKGDSYLLGKSLRLMREVKKSEEISALRQAISISMEGHIEMMKSLKPGMTEYQVQAAGEYVFKFRGAEDVGYPSICGGGENSTILHYVKNQELLHDGDLLLLDMGAQFMGYSADITRTLPVNGKFTEEQKIIYNLVLKAHDAAMAACLPGNKFNDPHYAAVDVIKNGLLELGIISDPDQYADFFMHGTSHYLGLDVHDAGTHGKLAPGNVITIEPGIYISPGSACDRKWWNIGIRIEDDVLITDKGYENLSVNCPVSVDEIEKIMKLDPDFVK